MAWSVDFMADDWTRISANEVVRRALMRLEARGKGILLLHDIQPATALGLPTLLHELKARGFKVVHVVQASPEHPKTATLPEQWRVVRSARAEHSIWPQVQIAPGMPDPVLETPSVNNFGIIDFAGNYEHPGPRADKLRADDRDVPLPPISLWPRGVRLVGVASAETMPAPDATNFRYSRVWKQRPAGARIARKPAKKDTKDTATASSTHTPASRTPAGPKGLNGTARSTSDPPRPPRPTGHQLQPPKQPTASLLQRIGLQ
jgi:hypothetical protein